MKKAFLKKGEEIVKWRKFVGFAVVWRENNVSKVKPEDIVMGEFNPKDFKKAKQYIQCAYPIFNTKKEAEAFRDGITDEWTILPVEINVPVIRKIS